MKPLLLLWPLRRRGEATWQDAAAAGPPKCHDDRRGHVAAARLAAAAARLAHLLSFPAAARLGVDVDTPAVRAAAAPARALTRQRTRHQPALAKPLTAVGRRCRCCRRSHASSGVKHARRCGCVRGNGFRCGVRPPSDHRRGAGRSGGGGAGGGGSADGVRLAIRTWPFANQGTGASSVRTARHAAHRQRLAATTRPRLLRSAGRGARRAARRRVVRPRHGALARSSRGRGWRWLRVRADRHGLCPPHIVQWVAAHGGAGLSHPWLPAAAPRCGSPNVRAVVRERRAGVVAAAAALVVSV
eukprot:364061-Chlamydomonas_euryale.AAC.1